MMTRVKEFSQHSFEATIHTLPCKKHHNQQERDAIGNAYGPSTHFFVGLYTHLSLFHVEFSSAVEYPMLQLQERSSSNLVYPQMADHSGWR